MVKFLSGTNYDGSQVPVCTYWSNESFTNPLEDIAELESGATNGGCIANHYFDRNDISCFNDGQCNSEGKCLSCTKYRYGEGMRMGISHSPPLEFFREFNHGLTDSDLVSPQLPAGGSAVFAVSHDQMPFHIIVRNIQAEIAKCCRWSAGDGAASQFVITQIIDGPDSVSITGANGGNQVLKGIRVKNSAFPQDRGNQETNPEGGSFFAVGTVVVAGWSDAPSFYLEPRTGLVQPGEDIVFKSAAGGTVNSAAKGLAPGVPGQTQNALSVIDYCASQAAAIANSKADLANQLGGNSGSAEIAAGAAAEAEAAVAAYEAVIAAGEAGVPLKATADAAATALTAADTQEAINSSSDTCSTALESLAEQVDIANVNCGGQPASDSAAASSRQLRSLAQALRFASRGGSTKCELAFTDENSAAQWNSPSDGSLPCNGMRSDCTFYSGPKWEYATTEKLEVGQKVTAEAIQELRYYSDDWTRYTNPEEAFNQRFSVPFIWAYKDFTGAGGIPDVADMALYRPAVLLAREQPGALTFGAYETMQVEKVSISNFTDLAFQKTVSRITPGSEGGATARSDSSTPYASKIGSFTVPTATRLKITHPPTETPFIYRSWTPEFTNRISLFGSASPAKTVYLVNNTALQNRERYNIFYGTSNMFDIPTSLPGASSDFNGQSSRTLIPLFNELEKEKSANQSLSPLGFDIATSTTAGFWESRVEVDLVHDKVNDIYAFILIDVETFIFEKVQVDCRVMHSVMKQDSFIATDFTIHDTKGGSALGIATGDIQKSATLTASPVTVLGNSEAASLDYGYYAWQFKDRGLRFAALGQGTDDLQPAGGNGYITESDASTYITTVGYRVVQYRETETIENWYLLQDCGLIMAAIASPNANRVMPLTGASGDFKALSPVLVDNGATGSVVAQWAPEEVTLRTGGRTVDLVLLYRNEDGVGLPANYAIYGPGLGSQNQFGRPDPTTDTLTIKYTYLRAQTHGEEGEAQNSPEGSGDVVNDNFYGDRTRAHGQSITIDGGLTSGSAQDRSKTIGFDQQDFVFVFKDNDGRPIGKKHCRFMVAYYNLACVSVEIFYAWRSTCTTYALFPDKVLVAGLENGDAQIELKATIQPGDLSLGNRVAGLLGPHPCSTVPNCGDHEVLPLGRLRKEFETIVNETSGEGEDAVTIQKAIYPSAGSPEPDPGNLVSNEPPGSIFQRKRGTLWYPYNVCERPRYAAKTGSIGGAGDSTELVNETLSTAGTNSGSFSAEGFEPGAGSQGGLANREYETHHIQDDVQARVLDVHSTLRACNSSYTYGNIISTGAGATFTGYGRYRGEIDQFWYAGRDWAPPPFGNFGRPVLMCEVSTKIGDYTPKPEEVAFRWMPMFPQREDIAATQGIFGERLESAVTRLLGSISPLGGVAETAPTTASPRYTHQALITNRGVAGEYPYIPYYPTFLPDSLLGREPNEQGLAPGSAAPRGTITTGWAWRESDKPISRAQGDSTAIVGMKFLLPDYFLDNRRMETRLRPAEGNYQITYKAPEYAPDGTVVKNATMQLGNGPEREIVIDFLNRQFGPALMPDTVYDTSKILGDAPFPCSQRGSSNIQLANLCGCEGNVDDLPEEEPILLPAQFIHADHISPQSYVGLYTTDVMGPAFTVDIPRETVLQPCCMCNYFLEHIYFSLDSTTLPVDLNFDPALGNSLEMNYTWSRVPHGFAGGHGQGAFDATENLSQNYQEKQGLLITRPNTSETRRLSKQSVNTYFPSTLEATENVIPVSNFNSDTDPKLLGGKPATEGRSRGEDEQITLDFTLNAYSSIKEINITFLAGRGMEVPQVILTGIPGQNRTGDFVTIRSGAILGQSSVTAQGSSVPDPNNAYSSADIQNGEVLFPVSIFPAYADLPFWDKFFQEFHLIFLARDPSLSMGIHSVQVIVDSLSATLVETIRIPERRYYSSSFSGGKNPEENLTGMDSASAYWRSTSTSADSGSNRHRAYAWGQKIANESQVGQGGGQPTISKPITELEGLQEIEYDKARALMGRPYTYSFNSFFPLDEQKWIDFLGGAAPSWTTTLTVDVSDLGKLSSGSGESETPTYGTVPVRTTWSAPGHAFVHDMVNTSYPPCCEECGPSMVVEYKFAHLHDGLAVVELAGFWSDFSSGPSFAGLAAAAPSISNNPDVSHMEDGDFRTQNGEPLSAAFLESAGLVRNEPPATGFQMTNYTTGEGGGVINQ